MTMQVTWRRDVEPLWYGGPIRRWLDRRKIDAADAERASVLVKRFMVTAAGLGLGRDTSSCAGLPGFSSPKPVHVVVGRRESITVDMMPGQLLAEYQEKRAEFAEGLGVASVSFRWLTHGRIVADLQAVDPLESVVDLPPLARVQAPQILLGLLEDGRDLRKSLDQVIHLIVQGSTRSGKSRWTYGYLQQLAGSPHVRISGSDVTGLLLRPFVDTRHGDHLALGTGSIEAHAEVLEALVKIMDERIPRIPEDLDVLPVSEEDPYELVVLEELPGLIRAAQAQDNLHKGQKSYVSLVARIQAAYGRLLAEGAKVGFRLVIIMQRADATIVGGFERSQATYRITFPVPAPADVQLLHPAVDPEVAAAHTTALPGRALVSGPGIPVARLRAPEMGSYADFRSGLDAVLA